MALFKKKIRVTRETFIADQAEESLTRGTEDLESILAASRAQLASKRELAMFSAFMPLLAMTLAGLHEDIQRGYVAHIAAELEKRFGEDSGECFRERILEYLVAFDKDIAEGKEHIIAGTITAAMEHILGVSDESVVIARLGLVKVLPSTLVSRTKFYCDLKFV